MRNRIRIGGVMERLLVRRQVRIDEPGQTLRHDLGSLLLFCGIGGFSAFEGFAGLNVLLLLRRKTRVGLGDDQYFIETIDVRRRFNDDVDEGVAFRISNHLFNRAYRQTAGKNLVTASREHFLSRLNSLIGEDPDDLRLSFGVTAQNAANAVVFQNDAGAAGLVVDRQYLCGMRIDFANLADDAISGDHRHLHADALVFSLVEIENPRLVRAAGSDDLGSDGGVNVLLLEIQHGLETLTLARVFKQCSLLQPEAVDGLLQFLVLATNIAQIKVVLPHAHSAGLAALNGSLGRGNNGVGPQSQQANPRAVAGVQTKTSGVGPAHLRGQSNDMRHKQHQQHQNISVADEERFHKSQRLVFSGQYSEPTV